VGASTSHNRIGLHWLLQGQLYFFTFYLMSLPYNISLILLKYNVNTLNFQRNTKKYLYFLVQNLFCLTAVEQENFECNKLKLRPHTFVYFIDGTSKHAVSSSAYIRLKDKIHAWLKCFGRKRSWRISRSVPTLLGIDWVKVGKFSVRILVTAETWTGHVPNASQKHYCMAKLGRYLYADKEMKLNNSTDKIVL
jgi:hypothetical protein